MSLNDFLIEIPRYGHAAARILHAMAEGQQGSALEDALKEFKQNDLTALAYSMMNMIDPYKAPEQIRPVAAMIGRYLVAERENKESKK